MHDPAVFADAPAPGLHATDSGHRVQFYEDEAFLCAVVADFVHRGLAAGQPALVIATKSHGEAIADRLVESGVEVARSRMSGQLGLIDARAMLGRIMVGGRPDEARFREVVGGAIDLATRGREGSTVWAFGEMVDLLWSDGNPEGAVELEVLWNGLARSHAFSLLCGYSISGFDRAEDAEAFLQICAHHDHVSPTERYFRMGEKDRLRWVTQLEQRAQALQSEVDYRRRLEQRLRLLAAEAAAANQAKAEFLANMSHELRTPLNAIAGYVELIEMGVRGPVTEAQLQDLHRIQQNQRHLLGLVNEVLNYTRLETGTVRYDPISVTMSEALHTVEGLVAPMARAKGLRLEVEPCDAKLAVWADAERLQQVLLNLLSNAVKFTDAGGQVWLRCERRDGMAHVVVRDSGVGIPEEKLVSIFEPFVQVRSGLTREHDGAGLGLAISRSIATAMEGSLTAESREGEGSTFTLALPLAGLPTAW